MASSHLFLLLSIAVTMMLFAVQGYQEHLEEMSDPPERSSSTRTRSRRRPARPGPSPLDAVGIAAMATYGRLPRKKQANPAALKAFLGNDFDENWMSIERPRQVVIDPNFDLGLPSYHKLWAELKKLNLTHSLHPILDSNAISAVEQWLLKKASCPVRFLWEDVGPLFWPRWIRRGECVNDSGEQACSWPSGMHCVPAESVTIHILRWNCQLNRKGSLNRRPMMHLRRGEDDLKCQWIRVPYPVTAECFCSC